MLANGTLNHVSLAGDRQFATGPRAGRPTAGPPRRLRRPTARLLPAFRAHAHRHEHPFAHQGLAGAGQHAEQGDEALYHGGRHARGRQGVALLRLRPARRRLPGLLRAGAPGRGDLLLLRRARDAALHHRRCVPESETPLIPSALPHPVLGIECSALDSSWTEVLLELYPIRSAELAKTTDGPAAHFD